MVFGTPVTDVSTAISRLPRRARVVAGPGCGGPISLLRELGRQALEGDTEPHLRSGLQLVYPFGEAVTAGAMRYDTWHVMGPVRKWVEAGRADYLPIRASQVPSVLQAWDPDALLVRVTPPDRHGYCSLGPSSSYPLPVARWARTVIGEIDESLPRTLGQSTLHVSSFAALVESTDPTPSYAGAELDEVSTAIARSVREILPPKPTLQLGIGAVPEALVASLADAARGELRFAGMGCDAMVALFENGVISPHALLPTPGVRAAELMGSPLLMEYADLHPGIGVYPSGLSHHPVPLGELDRFVSINSALEVDLWGQVNAEAIGGRQLSGVGGSSDFFEAAYNSDGGRRVIALPATTPTGTSRIVPRLDAGSVATVPRQMADLVVTEHGVADLRGRTLTERAEALVGIAAPEARDQLSNELARTTGSR
ncbi:hypothetical protein KG112_17180 [Nocardioides sp. zg-ZUI104]|uniref:acetyl-CoA hydrolase/transferase family protein n=1 Tax=Nocardioides faecalis TaxID=2803858 RepID=UPI001BCDF992|nr:acetyl-CoA hydrolase/transferase C-terminal domain-containing protein [Nocardioides faecalis]MBS4754545.1 hypothetical protein [Nocardioides faecalis]